MDDLFKNFSIYVKNAEFGSLEFWITPIVTVFLIWLLTMVGPKLFSNRKRLKTIFVIHNVLICASMIVASVLIGLICYLWSFNYFSVRPIQLSMLFSLFISLLIPVLSFLSLRNYFTSESLKEIVPRPKTKNHRDNTITETRKVYGRNKLFYLILIPGFLVLFFALNRGQNLISIVYDNSVSMDNKNAIEALSETFDNLDQNNEIVLTTLDGLTSDSLGKNFYGGKKTINEILAVTNYLRLQGGNVSSFNDPISAKNGLYQLTNKSIGSPLCESIWKSFLFSQETKSYTTYKNKVLIIITDGGDNVVETIHSGKFFFDIEAFAECYSPDKVFVIDYSEGTTNAFLQKFRESGCESYNVGNSKQDYLNALDNALNSFKNNWYLIYWMVIVVALMTMISLFIEPKKIV